MTCVVLTLDTKGGIKPTLCFNIIGICLYGYIHASCNAVQLLAPTYHYVHVMCGHIPRTSAIQQFINLKGSVPESDNKHNSAQMGRVEVLKSSNKHW